MTHVEIDQDLLPSLGKVESVLTDNCGSVEAYDFSKANSSYEARVQAITKVASICYGNPKALGSINLFNRLQAESHGLPSSSYEFVPVLIPADKYIFGPHELDNCDKFGEWLDNYLLTNLRALIEDVGPEESLKYLNTSDEEIQIIKDNFKVYLFNVDLSSRAQMQRHRVSWQELSRRYISGKKQPFEFYISSKLQGRDITVSDPQDPTTKLNFEELIELAVEMYNNAISNGIKPEEARRILPQAMTTTFWGAFQPKQLDNFFTLRLDKHAQKEIQSIAAAMKGLING